MQNSAELLKRAGILPKLRLVMLSGRGAQSTGPHTVIMVEDKIVKGMDYEKGEAIEKVRYIMEEEGVRKQYETNLKSKDNGELSYFVQRMAEIEPGTQLTLEYKRYDIRGYVEMTINGEVELVGDEDSEEQGEENEIT